jgi:two-component system, OmpR family, sensor histidine kinase MprB
LLDNAAKYGPREGVVSVVVDDGEVTVRDHGPGVPPAEAHGGSVGVEEADGGGAMFRLRLPVVADAGERQLLIEGEHEGGAVTSWQ